MPPGPTATFKSLLTFSLLSGILLDRIIPFPKFTSKTVPYTSWESLASLWKDPDAGKDWSQEEKGTTEDQMVGCSHQLSEHEFQQTLGDSEGQESLACCSPWGLKVQFSSVTQSCPTLCNPMKHSTPGFPVPHQLPEFIQTHLHWVGDAIQPSHLLSSSFSSHLQFFPASGSFPVSQFFVSGGQSIEVSASSSVLPVNTQDWSPLGWTGWISLQSKGLSRVFSNSTVQKHQFFCTQLSV